MASWFGDAAKEFHKLPTGGKIAVGITALAVAGIGYYEYKKNQSSNTGTQPAASANTGGSLPPQPISGGDTPPQPTTTPITNLFGNTTKKALFESTPGGTKNKGKNILWIPAGTKLTLLGNPISFNNETFYQTNYNGQSGYVNANKLNISTGGGGQKIQQLPYSTLSIDHPRIVQDYDLQYNGHLHPVKKYGTL